MALFFKTNVLLKNLVGKDLINDDIIAIIELVKNAYDAGSGQVEVRFEALTNEATTEASRIVIRDTGCGMNRDDIENKWLNIAYSEKKELAKTASEFLAGNKGIGRFSCDRLGANLDLLTRRKGGPVYHLPINWTRFEVEDQVDTTIQSIELELKTMPETSAAKLAGEHEFPAHGTILVISKLRSIWDRDRLIELRVALGKFLNPNQAFSKHSFKIALSAPDITDKKSDEEHRRVNGPVRNLVFRRLEFDSTYIEAELNPQKQTVLTRLHHQGSLVFEVEEKSSIYPNIKQAKIVLYYLNPYKKAYFKRQTGIRSVDFGSVFLFLNGFRVAPYGDRGDDWLGIDGRKTQGANRYLANRELIGRIEVVDSENLFKPISSREGLKRTLSFLELRDRFFMDVLRRLERFVVDGLAWDSVPNSIREELKNEHGLDWSSTAEQYSESADRKAQRIALSIMELIGLSAERTLRFWFDPTMLENAAKSRAEDVATLLADLDNVKGSVLDKGLGQSLARVRKLIAQRERETARARRIASKLKLKVGKQKHKIQRLKAEKETYKAQTLFMQSVAPQGVAELRSLHHQISLDSTIVDNFLAKVSKALRDLPPEVEASYRRAGLEPLGKAILANKRITAVAQFATKANFRAAAKREPTDIPAFIEQYLINVAKDFSATSVDLAIENQVHEPFEVKCSRIELSIVIDNIVNNSVKAMAKSLRTTITKVGANTLRVEFADDGRGLSPTLPSADSIFEMGITTTSGSGLGLFHSKRIIEEMGGRIGAAPGKRGGVVVTIEVTR